MNELAGAANRSFPRVSVLVMTYNQRVLLDRAVASAFAQEGPPIEIILSDDASTDGSYERLQTLAAAYRGPHRVITRRNPSNLGIGGHYNALVSAASGELLVTAAGDDASTPDRVRRLVAAWEATGRRADLIASHVIDLDATDQLHAVLRVDDLALWQGIDDWMAHRPHVIGAGHAFTRRLMDHFGPLAKHTAYEDQILAFRAICLGGACTVDAPLVHYRRGGLSARPRFTSGEDFTGWTLRQLDRWKAEAEQLIADADVAACGARMRAHLAPALQRDRYLRCLAARPPWSTRWRALREAPDLPLGWRCRKLLTAAFPDTTVRVKQAVRALHRGDRIDPQAARDADG